MYKCNKCDGCGFIKKSNSLLDDSYIVCNKCLGLGKLNWVENIFGKIRNNLTIEDFSTINVKQLCFNIDQEIIKELIKEEY